ncbi:MAG: YggS family pyridoxal phosphate-dependent enzyme [Clostridia bacterium]|nr:YggS family pyridoxal phosphate-dependent enzyme [Clostridia bacterium]
MQRTEIEARVLAIKAELEKGNPYGERVLLVAATKTQIPESINAAIAAGVDAVAENKPQEFRDKNESVLPCSRHFIGHLQTNKIKYLLGKIELYHSCDREELAAELARQSTAKGLISNVLIQINVGEESAKGGFSYEDAEEVFHRLSAVQGLKIKGFMAMLPDSDDEALLRGLARKMRRLFEWAKAQSSDVEYLSMGMSGDYKLCVEEGSNVVRLGSTIFGRRDYGATV